MSQAKLAGEKIKFRTFWIKSFSHGPFLKRWTVIVLWPLLWHANRLTQIAPVHSSYRLRLNP